MVAPVLAAERSLKIERGGKVCVDGEGGACENLKGRRAPCLEFRGWRSPSKG